MREKIVTIIALFLLVSCVDSRVKITQKTTSVKIYKTPNFSIFTAQKISDPKQDLRVYLEGDGMAYISEYEPSDDPTPTSYFLTKLIMEDDFPNVIYIARPCQYVESKNCEEKYWTDARFAPEIVDAIDQVIHQFPDKKLQLVGYSGGGAIAGYLAQRNNNITNIRTIAGNLDHQKFCEIHKVPLLTGSLPPISDFTNLEKIPQINFVGESDDITPITLMQEYSEKFANKSCVKILELKGANHFNGWKGRWKKLLQVEPTCAQLKYPANKKFVL